LPEAPGAGKLHQRKWRNHPHL